MLANDTSRRKAGRACYLVIVWHEPQCSWGTASIFRRGHTISFVLVRVHGVVHEAQEVFFAPPLFRSTLHL